MAQVDPAVNQNFYILIGLDEKSNVDPSVRH